MTAKTIVCGVDATEASRAGATTAIELARAQGRPLILVYVRRRVSSVWGAPFYQRRLTAEMNRARRVLDGCLRLAGEAGVRAQGEILEGKASERIVDLADKRGAAMIVVGSRRSRLRPSVAAAVVRAARRPVLVAAGAGSRARASRDRHGALGRAAAIARTS